MAKAKSASSYRNILDEKLTMECEACDELFVTPRKFRDHQRTTHGIDFKTCPFCTKYRPEYADYSHLISCCLEHCKEERRDARCTRKRARGLQTDDDNTEVGQVRRHDITKRKCNESEYLRNELERVKIEKYLMCFYIDKLEKFISK